MFMVMLVLDDPCKLDAVLDAWDGAGVRGVTILESTGRYRQKTKHIPMRYAFGECDVLEKGNITLLAIVRDEKTIQACLQATENITGDLDSPNTGVFASWPLSMVKGLPDTIRQSEGGI